MKHLHSARSGARLTKPPTSERVLSRWCTWPLAMLLAGGALMFVLSAPVVADEQAHHPRKNTFMKREWGIEILYVRQTAAGYMLEFRYKVVDAEKAQALFERQTKPMLTHAESGAKFIVPTPAKTGALRNSNPPKDGHTYWMFFANPGQFVKPGEHVSIEIGDFVVENLVVQ
jgi:hypothetical protein